MTETSSAASSTAAIEARGVAFSYNGAPVLQDVSFTVQRSEFVSILGPNGGGKTTLLKLLLGLLTPDAGTIRIFGEPPERVRHLIGYVPQHFQYDASFPVLVQDVVLMGRLGGGFTVGRFKRKDRDEAMLALREVGLYDMRTKRFSELSGGQRQRILIARALASSPQMLFLDEPTANIDAAVEKNLASLLHELNKRMTIIMVTHDVAFISTHVKRVVCVNRIVAEHPTSAVCGDIVRELYGADIAMVRHDHDGSGKPECLNS